MDPTGFSQGLVTAEGDALICLNETAGQIAYRHNVSISAADVRLNYVRARRANEKRPKQVKWSLSL